VKSEQHLTKWICQGSNNNEVIEGPQQGYMNLGEELTMEQPVKQSSIKEEGEK